MAYDHVKLALGEDVIVKPHATKPNKIKNVRRPLYFIVKNKNAWEVFYFEPGKKSVTINLDNIPGLQAALDNLPKTQITKSELIPIKKIIHAHHQRFGNYLGKGNGLQMTHDINLYLVDFFNAFLKDEKNPFIGCSPISKNTYLECGPGIF